MNIFFVGQPEFNDILMQAQNKAIRQRIGARYHLSPLSEDESSGYILHRMWVAGSERQVFTPKAMREVHAVTGGNPRRINILCDRALLTGYTDGSRKIGPKVIRTCFHELQLPNENRIEAADRRMAAAAAAPPGANKSFSFTGLVLGFLTAAGIVMLGYILLNGQYQFTLPWSPDEIAPAAPPRGLPTKEDALEAPAESTQPGPPVGGSIIRSQPETPATPTPSAPPVEPQPPASDQPVKEDQAQALNPGNIERVIIRFDFNSNDLPDEAYRALDRIVAALTRHSRFDVMVKGYTDNQGPLTYTRNVSEFRANMIKSYMVGKGVDPARITAQGMGPEDPIASNDTVEGRRLNRRVEIEFIPSR
jgi:general secretion pathway protein A